MKNSLKKKFNNDPILEVRKHPKFNQYYQEVRDKLKLAVKIYNARGRIKLSQQELAQKAKTTQKIISKIENAQYDIGFPLLRRVENALDINIINLGEGKDSAFSYPTAWLSKVNKAENASSSVNTDQKIQLKATKSNKEIINNI